MAVSFDLFGTLVDVSRPDDPASAVAAALADRGVAVPADWRDAYGERHVETPAGAELSLVAHVEAALESRGSRASEATVAAALRDAFSTPIRTRPGAGDAVAAAADRGPVGVLSNCSVPGLVERALSRSDLDSGTFDAVVSSVECGWRKPDERAFAAVADRLGVPLADLAHVGDDPDADGGAADAGATTILLDDVPLTDLPAHLERTA